MSGDCGPPFKHRSCWELLKDQPKFDGLPHPPSKLAESAHANDYKAEKASESEAEQCRQMVGRKRVKHQLKRKITIM